MIYAEGHNAPTKKFDSKEDAEREAKRIADKENCTVFILTDKNEIQPDNIMAKVKTFEDAVKILYGSYDEKKFKEKTSQLFPDELAYRKLKIIIEALNEGWKPDWSNIDEDKWYPYFYAKKRALFGGDAFFGASFGFASARATNVPADASTYIGSRLCFKSEKLADYAATQFIDLYNQFLMQ